MNAPLGLWEQAENGHWLHCSHIRGGPEKLRKAWKASQGTEL